MWTLRSSVPHPRESPAIPDQVQPVPAQQAPPAGIASNPQGIAAFVAAMVAHFAGQHAVTRIQVTNEPNNRYHRGSRDVWPTSVAALVSGIEAGSAAREEAGSRTPLGFNWFSSLGPVNDIAVAQVLDNLRTNLMPLAGLGSHVPMGISEIGWDIRPSARPLTEQAELAKVFTAGACSVAVWDHLGSMTWF